MANQTHFGWGPVAQDDTAKTITFRGGVAPGTEGATYVPFLDTWIGPITLDTTGYTVELIWFPPQFETRDGFLYDCREVDEEVDQVEIVLTEVQ
jgi:hypothetical protein